MRRHKSIINLSKDHHHGLMLAQLIKKNAPHYKNLPATLEGKVEYTLNAYKADLLPHFKKEEEILFPLFKGKKEKSEEIIKQLLNEHKKITELVNSLENNSCKEEILNELGKLLAQHIRKEERELFEVVQEIFNEEELEKLENSLS